MKKVLLAIGLIFVLVVFVHYHPFSLDTYQKSNILCIFFDSQTFAR